MGLRLEDIKGMKVLIMGLGLNGGGVDNARFFAEHGAEVVVTDLKDERQLEASVSSLSHFTNIEFHLGYHDKKDFADADIVIKNPAVKRQGNEYLGCAKQIESDVSFFAKLSTSPIIAVTGTKGKSFTATAIHYCLCKLGAKAFLAGNMGISPLRYLPQATRETLFVLELSSWQLADLKDCTDFKPRVAVITPIMRDHQNWYGNMESYLQDKAIIFQNQREDDCLILNYDDDWSRGFSTDYCGRLFWYTKQDNKTESNKCVGCVYIDDEGKGILKTKDGKNVCLIEEPVKIKGIEAKQNLLNAALSAYLLGFEPFSIANVMKDFKGIEHRMEFFFKTQNNISFYNDTAATIPEASCVALSAFLGVPASSNYHTDASTPYGVDVTSSIDARPVWITGGTDKGLDFSIFATAGKKAKKIFLLRGSATEKMIKVFDDANIEYQGPYESLSVLLNEIRLQVKSGEIKEGDNVVFSPASASFELFQNEFDRGNRFKCIVKDMFASY